MILIDQLKEIYIDGELELVDTPQWFPKILRKDYTVALNLQTAGPDPDQTVQLFYGCGSDRNWDSYCNPEIDKLIDQQSREADPDKRKQIVWEIERKLAEDDARPIIFYNRGGTCWQPLRQGPDDDGQQHLQRLAHGGRLARQVDGSAHKECRRANPANTCRGGGELCQRT